jgi:hypothetical protein
MNTLVADSKYKTYRLDTLPPGLFGETYAVTCALKLAATDFVGEVYVFTQRPASALFSQKFSFNSAGVPPDLLNADLDFIEEQARQLAEVHLIDQLQDRATSLNRPDLLSLNVRLIELTARPFMGCWLRGVFKGEITRAATETQCRDLSIYLGGVSRMQSFTYTQ